MIGAITPARAIAAGQRDSFRQRLYFGPKLQKELEQIAEGLELTVDYGIFWFIAKPLFWVLDHIHTFTDNWGWSIVLVTLLLKLIFYHLSAAGYRSMANMRKVQPRLLSIRERYKNDRARLNQAMMALYKEGKDQSARRLFSDPGADTRLYLALLGVARKRGIETGRFRVMDQ